MYGIVTMKSPYIVHVCQFKNNLKTWEAHISYRALIVPMKNTCAIVALL
jgi:hypothetical protein